MLAMIKKSIFCFVETFDNLLISLSVIFADDFNSKYFISHCYQYSVKISAETSTVPQLIFDRCHLSYLAILNFRALKSLKCRE